MILAVLILATIVDLALAALLIGVSGFMFGSGPESTHSGALLQVAYAGFVIACVALPIAGFILHRRGKTALGIAARLAAAGRCVAGAGDSGAVLTASQKQNPRFSGGGFRFWQRLSGETPDQRE